MNGWIKLHRKMITHAVWSLPEPQFKVWITLLLEANHQERESWVKGELLNIQPGYIVRSQRHLAEDAKVGHKVVRDALRHLEQIGSIRTHKRTQRKVMIEIVNWPIYQGDDDYKGTKEDNSRAQQGHIEGTTVRREEGKNTTLHQNGFDSFWSLYPKKIGKLAALKAWKKINPNPEVVETIVQAVGEQKACEQWSKDNGQFIPYPATWLNQGRWEDKVKGKTEEYERL
jgi:hypothetical protein